MLRPPSSSHRRTSTGTSRNGMSRWRASQRSPAWARGGWKPSARSWGSLRSDVASWAAGCEARNALARPWALAWTSAASRVASSAAMSSSCAVPLRPRRRGRAAWRRQEPRSAAARIPAARLPLRPRHSLVTCAPPKQPFATPQPGRGTWRTERQHLRTRRRRRPRSATMRRRRSSACTCGLPRSRGAKPLCSRARRSCSSTPTARSGDERRLLQPSRRRRRR
mmetsp:Transcript_86706/g.258744  ORF Transcript_86706/g.258744 Transcript_86706/m.258744 type:complete len:223 (+) Transcript_86706:34-702(+)